MESSGYFLTPISHKPGHKTSAHSSALRHDQGFNSFTHLLYSLPHLDNCIYQNSHLKSQICQDFHTCNPLVNSDN
ncbi:unnamed protein product, partial [Arabidopsis halleri]